MEKHENYRRFSNILLKNKQSEAGFHIYISAVAQKQLDILSGHVKTRAYQSIQSLASDPFPGISESRICARSQNSTAYLVVQDIAVKFKFKSEKVFVDAIKPSTSQNTSCRTASVESTIGALKKELHYLESLSSRDFGTMQRFAGFSGNPTLELAKLQDEINREIARLTVKGAGGAISSTPSDTVNGAAGALASASSGYSAKVGLASHLVGAIQSAKTLAQAAKLFGDYDASYVPTYNCGSICKLDILIKD